MTNTRLTIKNNDSQKIDPDRIGVKSDCISRLQASSPPLAASPSSPPTSETFATSAAEKPANQKLK
jgi:hypothetical protein